MSTPDGTVRVPANDETNGAGKPRACTDADASPTNENADGPNQEPRRASPTVDDTGLDQIKHCDALIEYVRHRRDGEIGWEAAQKIFRKAIALGIEPAVLKRLEILVRARAQDDEGLLKDAISQMVKDERNRVADQGVADTPRAAAKMVIEALKTHPGYAYSDIVSVDGFTYVHREDGGPDSAADTGFYEKIEDEEIILFAIDTLGEIDALSTARKRSEVIEEVRAQTMRPNEFADAPAGINLADCFLRWSPETNSFERLRVERENKARMRLSVCFDPSAHSPALLKFLARSIPDPHEQQAFQEFVAAIVFNLRILEDAARKLFILYGPTRCGKSLAIDMILGLVLGDSIGSVPLENWTSETYRAALVPLKVNVIYELSGRMKLRGDIGKQVLSGDLFSARNLYGRPFHARCDAYHVAATNSLFRVDDQSGAFERRVGVITFGGSLSPDEVDGNLLNQLRQELPGVINWAMEGARRLMARGRFLLGPGHRPAVTMMQFGADPVEYFTRLHVEADPSNARGLPGPDIKKAMIEVADQLGSPSEIGNGEMRRFSDLVQRLHGAQRAVSNGVPHYRGIRLIWPD